MGLSIIKPKHAPNKNLQIILHYSNAQEQSQKKIGSTFQFVLQKQEALFKSKSFYTKAKTWG